MTTEKKKSLTNLERQNLSLARLQAQGGKRITVRLSKQAVSILERLNKEFETQNEVIEYALLNLEQRTLL